MRNKLLIAATTVGSLSVISMHAQAQSAQHALQLGISTSVVSYTSASPTIHEPQANGTTLDVDYLDHTTNWGFGNRNNVTLEGGYGLTDSLVIGGILDLGGISEKFGPSNLTAGETQQTESRFSLFLGPKVDYMLLPNSIVRPMFSAAIGLIRQTESVDATDRNNVTTNQYDFGATGVGLIGRAGIRWFLTPGFSLDPAFVFGFSTMSGSVDTPAAGGATLSYDASLSGYTLGLSIGFSGWVGI